MNVYRHSETPKLGLRGMIAALTAAVVLASGCTAIPVKDFASYREAVNKTRAAAETVVTEHSVARAEYAALSAGRKPSFPGRPASFDPLAAAGDRSAIDYTAVRFQAWEVVVKYNDALAALAEGRSAAGVGTAVDGLVGSLTQSPFAEAKDFAAGLAPFLSSLKVVLAEADKEAARQRFLVALSNGLPLIKNELLPLLRSDAQAMSRVKFGLNDLKYEQSLDKLDDERRAFDALTKALAPNDDIKRIRAELNDAFAKIPRPKSTSVRAVDTASGTEALTPVTLAIVRAQRKQMLESVANIVRINDSLLAYYGVMASYVDLIDKLNSSISLLQKAAEGATGVGPPSDELVKAVIALRQAYQTYTTNP